MNESIRLRPHHFVDIVDEFGRGKRQFLPHRYGHALHVVADRLLKDANLVLLITINADAICRGCIFNVDGTCEDVMPEDYTCYPGTPAKKEEWNRRIDKRWCSMLGISPGDERTAGEFCRLILRSRDRIGEIYSELPASMAREKGLFLEAGSRFLLTRAAGSGKPDEGFPIANFKPDNGRLS